MEDILPSRTSQLRCLRVFKQNQSLSCWSPGHFIIVMCNPAKRPNPILCTSHPVGQSHKPRLPGSKYRRSCPLKLQGGRCSVYVICRGDRVQLCIGKQEHSNDLCRFVKEILLGQNAECFYFAGTGGVIG